MRKIYSISMKDKIYCFFIVILYAFGMIGIGVVEWAAMTFGVSFEAIIYTLSSPMKGADTHFLLDAVKYCYKYIAVYLVFIFLFFLIEFLINKRNKVSNKLIVTYRVFVALGGAILSIVSLYRVDKKFNIINYLNSKLESSTIFESYYAYPDDVKISQRSNKKKNLLWICMESMEITYASKSVGGFQKANNYIPNLTQRVIDGNGISFSNKDDGQLGGFYAPSMTGWTMAALMAQTSGTPFLFPIEGNSMDKYEYFAPNLVTLGDILEKEGYTQEFLCGSEAEFAGRKNYFEQHGNYKIFDYDSAIANNYISKDYRVWWGFEDSKLYTIAKDELTNISKGNTPFNFMLLTVDTHHVDGYVCSLCDDKYSGQLENVVACADKQVEEFLEWCEQQEWYDDTVIVITGDHPRMDSSLVDGINMKDRRVYNYIQNAMIDNLESVKKSNRECLSFDMFPTVLYAIGYEIKGERLGLGTNLFSDKATLAEQLGINYIDYELQKHSKYFEEYFY